MSIPPPSPSSLTHKKFKPPPIDFSPAPKRGPLKPVERKGYQSSPGTTSLACSPVSPPRVIQQLSSPPLNPQPLPHPYSAGYLPFSPTLYNVHSRMGGSPPSSLLGAGMHGDTPASGGRLEASFHTLATLATGSRNSSPANTPRVFNSNRGMVLRSGDIYEGKGGSYEILEKIGEGGKKIVFLANQRRTDRLVVIVFTTELRELAKEAENLMFCRELSGVVDVIEEPHQDPETSYSSMVIEYCSGGDLVSWARRGTTLKQRLGVLLNIARTLDRMHNQVGFAHRDVKPLNMGVSREGKGKVFDLGEATKTMRKSALNCDSPESEASGIHCGTLPYYSPYGDKHNPPSGPKHDVYSLAASIFDMCFPHEDSGVLARWVCYKENWDFVPAIYLFNATFECIESVVRESNLHKPIEELLLLMLNTNPSKRCTMSFVVRRLEEILEEADIHDSESMPAFVMKAKAQEDPVSVRSVNEAKPLFSGNHLKEVKRDHKESIPVRSLFPYTSVDDDNSFENHIIPYVENYPELFSIEKERLERQINLRSIEIAHIGSTAVHGLSSGPGIIDIMIRTDKEQISDVAAILKLHLDYAQEPERELSDHMEDSSSGGIFNFISKDRGQHYRIRLMAKDSSEKEWQRNINFLKFLNEHPESVSIYQERLLIESVAAVQDRKNCQMMRERFIDSCVERYEIENIYPFQSKGAQSKPI